ncbi:MAG: hypothetical protein R2849_12355 [Thermomicrobiales bacterium]
MVVGADELQVGRLQVGYDEERELVVLIVHGIEAGMEDPPDVLARLTSDRSPICQCRFAGSSTWAHVNGPTATSGTPDLNYQPTAAPSPRGSAPPASAAIPVDLDHLGVSGALIPLRTDFDLMSEVIEFLRHLTAKPRLHDQQRLPCGSAPAIQRGVSIADWGSKP